MRTIYVDTQHKPRFDDSDIEVFNIVKHMLEDKRRTGEWTYRIDYQDNSLMQFTLFKLKKGLFFNRKKYATKIWISGGCNKAVHISDPSGLTRSECIDLAKQIEHETWMYSDENDHTAREVIIFDYNKQE